MYIYIYIKVAYRLYLVGAPFGGPVAWCIWPYIKARRNRYKETPIWPFWPIIGEFGLHMQVVRERRSARS